MGRQLEVPRVIVSSAIRHLVRVGAMGKGTRDGGDLRSYQMSPNLVWKGTPEAHELALERYDRMKAAGITRVLSTPLEEGEDRGALREQDAPTGTESTQREPFPLHQRPGLRNGAAPCYRASRPLQHRSRHRWWSPVTLRVLLGCRRLVS